MSEPDGERQPQDVEQWYERLAAVGLPYGPAFRNLASIAIGEGYAVADVQAADCIKDAHLFHVHPGLLDTCFQVLFAGAFGSADGEGTYLPAGIAKLSLWKQRAGARLRVIARRTRANETEREGELAIYDAEGDLVATLHGVRAVALDRRDTASGSRSLSRAFSRVTWEAVDVAALPAVVPAVGAYCVFADEGGIGRRLATELERSGCEVVLVSRAAEYREAGREVFLAATSREHHQRLFDRLYAAASSPLRGVIYLWGLDGVANSDVTSAALNDSLMVGAAGLITAAQEMSQRGKLPLWVVTQQAQVVAERQEQPSLSQAPLWGIASTLFYQDCRELAGGIIDLPAEVGPREIETTLTLMRGVTTDDTHFALRDGAALVWRIVAAPEYSERQRGPKLRADRSYVITGGLGGLGLLCARWLVERGARRLVLMARSGLPSRDQWARLDPTSETGKKVRSIQEIEAMGASIHVAKLDVADDAALARYFEDYRQQQYPAIGGVIHCAGALSPAMLNNLDVSLLPAETGAKIAGGWALHRVLDNEPLEFFVLFSSLASFGGSMGLSYYAAGNSFLDALAHFRRAAGRPAISVDWGAWGEVGMVSSEDRVAHFRARGLDVMPPKMGLDALECLFGHRPVQAIVMPDCWSALALDNFPGSAPPLFLSRMETVSEDASGAGADSHEESMVVRLQKLADDGERVLVLEEELRRHIARVLRMDPGAIDSQRSLTLFGLDSLMAVELRNKIETAWGFGPTLVELLQGGSVKTLSTTLLTRVPEPEIATDASLLLELGQLPLHQVEAMLAATPVAHVGAAE